MDTAPTQDTYTDRQLRLEIYDVGVPSFLETLFTTFASIIDSKMVSSMGVAAISAISVTNQPRLFTFSLFFALNTVTSSLVARYLGQHDRDGANRTLDAVLKLVTILSVILSILSVALARPIMIVFAKQPDTIDASVTYYRIIMGGMIFNLLYMAINSALRGCGKTRLTFTSNALSAVVNIFFNYLLIDGHLGFPALGIAGAALATVLGNVAAFLLSLIFAMNRELFVNIPYCLKGRFHMTRENTAELKSMAQSTVTDNLVMRFSLLIIGAITARIGSFQMAIYSVGMHLLNINLALGTGLQTAGVALIGRSFGNGDRKRMKRYKAQMTRIGVIAALALGLIIILTGRLYYGFFSSDPEFIRVGSISCILIGIITLFQTMKFVYSGCLQGIGAMKDVMNASIVSFAFVNISLLVILVLVFRIGIWGTWIASLASQGTQAFMLLYFIRRNQALTLDPPAGAS